MATTLSVSEMLPNKFEPKRKYRWIFQIEGIDAFLMKTAQRPTFQFEEIKIDFINAIRYLNGKMSFGEIRVSLHDPIAPSGAQQVMEWIRTHYESVSGRAGYADFYKRDCMIKNANFQDLDYTDGTTPMAIDLQLRIDNCVLQF